MPTFDVSMPNPDDVSDAPRKEKVEAPDEHSALLVASERYGRQPTEIKEARKAAKKATTKKAPAKKAATKKAAAKKATAKKVTTKKAATKRTSVSRKADQTQKADQKRDNKKLTADPEDGKGQLNSHTKASDNKPADPQSADNSGTQNQPDFMPAGGSDK